MKACTVFYDTKGYFYTDNQMFLTVIFKKNRYKSNVLKIVLKRWS